MTNLVLKTHSLIFFSIKEIILVSNFNISKYYNIFHFQENFHTLFHFDIY